MKVLSLAGNIFRCSEVYFKGSQAGKFLHPDKAQNFSALEILGTKGRDG